MTDVFRSTYRELTPEEAQLVADVKTTAGHLFDFIDQMPAGREKSLAITKLEESVMWAVKGITG